MKLSKNVHHGPRNRQLHFGDVPDSVGTLTLDLQKIMVKEL